MKKIKALLFVLVFITSVFAQDTIQHTNGEKYAGRVKSFANQKFTILLSDKTEITFAKDSVLNIVFDTDGIYENVSVIKQEEEMDRDCATKNIGNVKFVNTTGLILDLSIENKDKYSYTKYKLSASNDVNTYNGLPAGNYVWVVNKDSYTEIASGGFYVPPCKTAKIIYIK